MAVERLSMGEVIMKPDSRASARHRRNDAGFSLLEAIISILILTIGLFALAQVMYAGVSIASTSSPNLVAREKAREAIESVHTARDTHTILWASIRNFSAPDSCVDGTTGTGGGVFQNGAQIMRTPGPDGLVNTADDTGLEVMPGPDGVFGGSPSDDVPLTGYTRQIEICDIVDNPNLRRITVTVRYNVSIASGFRQREYRLVTLISRFS